MNEDDKQQYIKEFKEAKGSEKLDMWDFALEQQVQWEGIIAELQKISSEQGVDKKLEKMMEDDMKNL